MRISGSVVLVTGGASGLGEAVVRRAVDGGAAGVAIVDVSADRADALAAELGPTVLSVPTDITDTDQVAAAVANTLEKFGAIDLLVACAGIPIAERTVDREGNPADFGRYSRVIAVNLLGTFDIVSKVAASMSKTEPNDDGERGVIIMTASAAAFDGQIGQVAYSASKGGIVGMTLPLARDLGVLAIRVNTIAPGLIQTPIYDYASEDMMNSLGKGPVFPQRFGTPAEFAHLVEAIAENTYLNGEVIRLDGGIRMPPK
ncbi:MAG: SDR family NAD(P)-dependent oxidoreductase [bacterium]|nr:SDR family NAD(P)-dependent oxidoreductase [bacterium]